jgi:hypothetical protein
MSGSELGGLGATTLMEQIFGLSFRRFFVLFSPYV